MADQPEPSGKPRIKKRTHRNRSPSGRRSEPPMDAGQGGRGPNHGAHHGHSSSPEQGSRLAGFARNAARLLALAIVAFGPWYYGSAGWNAQLVCVVASLTVVTLAVIFRERRLPLGLSVPHLCAAAIIVLAWLQVVPLPRPISELLSPNAAFHQSVTEEADRLLALEQAATPESPSTLALSGETPLWPSEYPSCVSVYADHTLASAAVVGSALALMLAGTLLFQDRRWQVGLLLTLVVVGIANAMVGLLQSVAFSGWTLLDDMNPNSFSTFINRNSVAQYYSIALGACLALLVFWHQRRDGGSLEKRYHVRYPAVNLIAKMRRRVEDQLTDLDPASILLLVTLTLLLAAVMAAASRGGIVACLFAVAVSMIRLLGSKAAGTRLALGAVIIGFLCLGFLSSLELDNEFSTRLGSLSEELHQFSNVRLALWAGILGQSSYWLCGSGLGTFHLAVLTIPPIASNTWFYHAENIYIEVFTTLGILGAVLLIGCLAFLLKYLLFTGRHRHSLLRVATLLPVVAIACQSLTDFSLILPAIFMPLALLVGATCGERAIFAHAKKQEEAKRNPLPARSSRPSLREGDAGQAVATRHPSATEKAAKPGDTRHPPARGRVGRGQPRSGAAAGEGLSSLFSSSSPIPLYACLALLAASAWFGIPILADFAKAEALARNASSREATSVNLEFEIARQQQLAFTQAVRQLPWPDAITEKQQMQFSKPEVFVAAVRGVDDRLAELKDFVAQDNRLIPLLAATGEAMQKVVTLSPRDWRASWGLVRGDLQTLEKRERIFNAAQLLVSARHKPALLRAAGTHFLWSGERILGREFWRDSLSLQPRTDSTFYATIIDLLDAEDVDYVCPESPFLRVKVAQQLERRKATEKAEVLLAAIDLQAMQGLASNASQWQQVSWLASERSDSQLKLEALRQAGRAAPMDHKISFALAKAYDEVGQVDQALEEIDRSLRQSPTNQRYLDFKESLEAR